MASRTAGRRWPPRRRSSRRGPTPRSRAPGAKLSAPEAGPPRRGPLPRGGAGRDTLLGAKATPSSPATRRYVTALGPPQPRGNTDSACAALPQPVPHEPREAAFRLVPGSERRASVSPARIPRRRRRVPAMWDPRAARCVAGVGGGRLGLCGPRVPEAPRGRPPSRRPRPGAGRRAPRPGRGGAAQRRFPRGDHHSPFSGGSLSATPWRTRLAAQPGSRCAKPRGAGGAGSAGSAGRRLPPGGGGLRPLPLRPPRPTLRRRPRVAGLFAQERGLSLLLGPTQPCSSSAPKPHSCPRGLCALVTRCSGLAGPLRDSAPCGGRFSEGGREMSRDSS